MRSMFGPVVGGERKELGGGEKGPGGGWPCVRCAGGSYRTLIWPGISEAAGCGTPEKGQATDGGRLAIDWIGLVYDAKLCVLRCGARCGAALVTVCSIAVQHFGATLRYSNGEQHKLFVYNMEKKCASLVYSIKQQYISVRSFLRTF